MNCHILESFFTSLYTEMTKSKGPLNKICWSYLLLLIDKMIHYVITSTLSITAIVSKIQHIQIFVFTC